MLTPYQRTKNQNPKPKQRTSNGSQLKPNNVKSRKGSDKNVATMPNYGEELKYNG
jgi:hypothetical protein